MTSHILPPLSFVCAALLFCALPAMAQPTGGWPGRPRMADGKLSMTLGAGATRYFGEFTDQSNGFEWNALLRYAVLPWLDVGANVYGGSLRYTRRNRRNMGETYKFQFGSNEALDRDTDLLSIEGLARMNLFAYQPVNVFVDVGAGAAMFSPRDYIEGTAEYLARTPITALSAQLGAGIEYFFSRDLSVSASANGHFVLSGELDAFDSGELVRLYDQEQNPAGNPERAKTAYDSYLSLRIGVSWYLFADNDTDGDRLSNDKEAAAGTNPYDPDTDGDDLDDFLEVERYRTNPLFWDSDNDGLSDHVEVTKYKTNPNAADTDGDGLSDREEIMVFGTDPKEVDSDGDGLSDSDEKRLGCNPRKVDTDGDGIYDGDEVSVWRTSPVLPDSDGDGINDYDEIYLHRTDPVQADTDKDGLTDFEEIRLFRTNPLVVDTDGDGATDYDEIRKLDSDPLRSDQQQRAPAQRAPGRNQR